MPPRPPARALGPNRWSIDPKAVTRATRRPPGLAIVALGVCGTKLVWADLVGLGPQVRIVGSQASALAVAWACSLASGVVAPEVRVEVCDGAIPPYPHMVALSAEELAARQPGPGVPGGWWASECPTQVVVCEVAPAPVPGQVAIVVGGPPEPGEVVIDTDAPELDLGAFGIGMLSVVLADPADLDTLDAEVSRLCGPGEPLAPLDHSDASVHAMPAPQPLGGGESVQVGAGGQDQGASLASVTTLAEHEASPGAAPPMIGLLGRVKGLEGIRGLDYKAAVLLALHRGEVRRGLWAAELGMEERSAAKAVSRLGHALGAQWVTYRTEETIYGRGPSFDRWAGATDIGVFLELAHQGDYLGAFGLIRGPICHGQSWLEDLDGRPLDEIRVRVRTVAEQAVTVLRGRDRTEVIEQATLALPYDDGLPDLFASEFDPEADFDADFGLGPLAKDARDTGQRD